MFYHDHSYGLTRLNVYAGMAAPYLLTDSVEDGLINSRLIPGFGDGVYFYGIPLIIQDKTFVPKDINTQDNKWNPWRTENGIAGGLPGDLWLPHVYEPNQDPTVLSGASLFGRWDYGPWFWPIVPTTTADPPGPYGYAHLLPGMTDFTNPWVYNKSIVPEAFMDTMLVNGTVYPYVEVQPRAYRLRILNACNDRNLNVQMYVADTGGGSGAIATATVATGMVTKIVVSGGTGYTSAPSVYITGGGGSGATATAALTPQPVASIKVTNGGSGYPPAPTVTLTGGGGTGATATATLGVVTGITITSPGTNYTTAPLVTISGAISGVDGIGASAMAALTPGAMGAVTVTNPGSGYTSAPKVAIGHAAEVKMVDAIATPGYPATWPTDGRDGGVPDPATVGPNLIQIGSEGGLLPAVALIPSQPVNYEYNRRNIVVLNVTDRALFMGPAERGDVIVDFSGFAGKTLILYNDAPAPVPAFDPRWDYYTGNPDQRVNGGAATTLPGYGPNTRTIMQIRVANTAPSLPFNLPALQAATGLPAAYFASQPPPIVPQPEYGPAFGATFPATYARIQNTSLTFTDTFNYFGGGLKTIQMQPKCIQELFDNYGRMNATLGTEIPFSNSQNQTTIPLQFIDPPTEGGDPGFYPGAVPIKDGDTQIWKITHNGVDVHSIHIHLTNWQVINRVGWDGAITPPYPNELGWKETVRMNPLEDIIVAAQFKLPKVPATFGVVPLSNRPLDPTSALGTTAQFSPFDALGNPIVVSNANFNFGWEYVWHCHLLGHEENDMMRPIRVDPLPIP